MKSIPENIEEYIANEIKDNCSDEFIVNRLGNFGIKEEDAILLIKKVKKEKKVNNEQSYFDDAETGKIHGWLLFILVLMGVGCIYGFVKNWVVSVVMNSGTCQRNSFRKVSVSTILFLNVCLMVLRQHST